MRIRVALPSLTVGLLLLVPTAPAAGADAVEGGQLYKRYCAGCHGADGRGGAHTFMPHIENLTEKGHIDQLTDEYLVTVIKEGGPAVGKSSYMPAWGKTLSDQQVADIIAHIRELPRY